MTVRCKLLVTTRTETQADQWEMRFVGVQAAPGEDSISGKYTPQAEAMIHTIQSVLAVPFAPRSRWYVDFYTDGQMPPAGAVFSCLYRCREKAEIEGGEGLAYKVAMQAYQRSGNDADEARLGRYAYQQFVATILNAEAAAQLAVGSVYLAVFTPAEA